MKIKSFPRLGLLIHYTEIQTKHHTPFALFLVGEPEKIYWLFVRISLLPHHFPNGSKITEWQDYLKVVQRHFLQDQKSAFANVKQNHRAKICVLCRRLSTETANLRCQSISSARS
mmetsp:Transcript_27685/g.57966  ORF Transcript_27685/g.57966 Transcript_27685/m.57966 type:complete len:115 (+) Transcript_27685:1574-1918(+)